MESIMQSCVRIEVRGPAPMVQNTRAWILVKHPKLGEQIWLF